MATQLRVGSVEPRFFQAITLSPSQVPQNTVQSETYTVNGLQTDMMVDLQQTVKQTGIMIVGQRVSAANTLQVDWENVTNSPITPTASQTLFLIGY